MYVGLYVYYLSVLSSTVMTDGFLQEPKGSVNRRARARKCQQHSQVVSDNEKWVKKYRILQFIFSRAARFWGRIWSVFSQVVTLCFTVNLLLFQRGGEILLLSNLLLYHLRLNREALSSIEKKIALSRIRTGVLWFGKPTLYHCSK